jgi:hypothetical protein
VKGSDFSVRPTVEATELAQAYLKAALKIYKADEIDDSTRDRFRKVVRNADLSAPLEGNILTEAKKELATWP